MSKHRLLLIIVAVTWSAFAAPQVPEKQIDSNPWRYDANEMLILNAEQFLSELCRESSDFPVTVRQMDNWVRMADLPLLIARAEEHKPCRGVLSAHSSFIPHGKSTLAREAKFMILGLRACSYPPALDSLRTPEWQLDDALRWGKLMVARGEKGFCAEPSGISD